MECWELEGEKGLTGLAEVRSEGNGRDEEESKG